MSFGWSPDKHCAGTIATTESLAKRTLGHWTTYNSVSGALSPVRAPIIRDLSSVGSIHVVILSVSAGALSSSATRPAVNHYLVEDSLLAILLWPVGKAHCRSADTRASDSRRSQAGGRRPACGTGMLGREPIEGRTLSYCQQYLPNSINIAGVF